MPPPTLPTDATPPETPDLIAVLAAWEREHGTLAAILPHEYADLCERLKRAALLKSPRTYTPPETADERQAATCDCDGFSIEHEPDCKARRT